MRQRRHAGPRSNSWPEFAAWTLLAAWIALGAVHTSFSLFRQGIRPASPPAIGLAAAAPVEDVARLRSLLAGRGHGRVLLALPPSADTSEVLYLRYQLAHLYPLHVFAARVSETGSVLNEYRAVEMPIDFLVSADEVRVGPEWHPLRRSGKYTLWIRASS